MHSCHANALLSSNYGGANLLIMRQTRQAGTVHFGCWPNGAVHPTTYRMGPRATPSGSQGSFLTTVTTVGSSAQDGHVLKSSLDILETKFTLVLLISADWKKKKRKKKERKPENGPTVSFSRAKNLLCKAPPPFCQIRAATLGIFWSIFIQHNIIFQIRLQEIKKN